MRLTADAQTLKKSLGKSELVPLSPNPVDVVWGSERQQRPQNPVFALDIKYSGLNASSSSSPYALTLIRGNPTQQTRTCATRVDQEECRCIGRYFT